MDKYNELTELLFYLKEDLNEKGFLDREIESSLMFINKKIDNIKKLEHEDKKKIMDLVSRL